MSQPLDLRQLPPADHQAAIEYDKFLITLTFNSKEIINSLTRIAQENTAIAPVICYCIEFRIVTAGPVQKLPFLYLLDSIIKNVGSPYKELISARAMFLIGQAYSASNVDNCARIRRLLGTWIPVYGAELVKSISVSLDQIDASRGQKVTAAMAGSNLAPGAPRGGAMAASAAIKANKPMPPSALPAAAFYTTVPPQGGVSMPVPIYPGQAVPAHGAIAPHHITPPPTSSTAQTIQQLELQIKAQFDTLNAHLRDGRAPPQELVASLVSMVQKQMYMEADGRKKQNLAILLDTLANLTQASNANGGTAQFAGGISAGSTARMPSPIPDDSTPPRRYGDSNNDKKRLNLCSKFEMIKSVPCDDAVYSLYQGLPHVSKMDGARFLTKELLRKHLDWLFEFNKSKRMKKDGASLSRGWFAPVNDWIANIKEVGMSGADVAAIFNRSGTASGGKDGAAAGDSKVTVIPKSKADQSDSEMGERIEAAEGNETCGICGEAIGTQWDDETSAWLLKGAVRDPSDALRVFHARCARLNTSPALKPSAKPNAVGRGANGEDGETTRLGLTSEFKDEAVQIKSEPLSRGEEAGNTSEKRKAEDDTVEGSETKRIRTLDS